MNKGLIREGYNAAADDYSKTRHRFNNTKYLKKLVALLKPNSTILDIGCGAGLPIDKFFADKGHKVLGIDISGKQIGLARRNVPQGSFEVKDMSELKKGSFKADAVISFYAIFHIPREEHEALFKKINSFLPPDGLLLVTMGSNEWEGVESNFHGVEMWWSHYGANKNRQIVESADFEIIFHDIDTSNNEKHQIILARKKILKPPLDTTSSIVVS